MKVVAVLALIVACAVAEEAIHGASHDDVSRINKMLGSVNRIAESFKGSHVPAKLHKDAMDNIGKIREDFERIKGADEHTRKNLVEAVHLRLQALKETKQSVVDLEKAPTKPASKLASKKALSVHKPMSKAASKSKDANLRAAAHTDLEKIESSLHKANYGEAKLSQINSNIAGMKKDLNEMEHATQDRRTRLMEALKLRMQALKSQMGSEGEKTNSAHDQILKSEHDLEVVKADVAHSTGPTSLKTEINSNIATMKKDLTELETSTADRHNKLVEALKLRMKALKVQVNKLHKGETPAHQEAASFEADEHQAPALSKVHSIEQNLEAMTSDLHKLHDPKVSHNMREALKLRLKALNEQMKSV